MRASGTVEPIGIFLWAVNMIIGGGDRSYNRPGGRDRLEVIAEEHVAAGRHEVDAVHVHPGRRRPFGVRLDNVPVDAFGVQVVGQINGQHAEDDDPRGCSWSAPSSIEWPQSLINAEGSTNSNICSVGISLF